MVNKLITTELLAEHYENTKKVFVMKKDQLRAGENITIENNTINATSDVTKDYVDKQLKTKANIENVYNKEEIDTLLEAKADSKTVDFQGTAIKDLQTKNSQQSSENIKQNNDIALLNRKVSALEQLNEGVSYRFETDSTEAYSKVVPSGAKAFDLKSIGGKSVVVNQFFNENNFLNTMNLESGGSVSLINHKLIINGITTKGSNYFFARNAGKSAIKLISGHKYLLYGFTKHTGMTLMLYDYSIPKTVISLAGTSSATHLYFTADADYIVDIYFNISNANVTVDIECVPQMIDITQMFGAGNEPTLEECQQIFTEYIPYTEPTIISQSVENVKVKNKAGEITHNLTIPNECKNLEGYGWSAGDVYNEVDFANRKFIQRVANYMPKVGDKMGTSNSTYSYVYVNDARLGTTNIKAIVPNDCYKIKMNTDNQGMVFSTTSKVWESDQAFIDWFSDKGGIYYELAEPIITDISDLLDNRFEAISCEANGSITFEGANGNYHLPIPNEEEYMIKLSEV